MGRKGMPLPVRTWCAGNLILLLLLAPTVAAEGLDARFVVSSALEAQGSNNLTLDPVAFAVNTTGLTMLAVESSKIELCEYEQVFPEVAVGKIARAPYVRSGMACYALTDVRMALTEGQHEGWFAVHAAHGSALRGQLIRAETHDVSVLTSPGHATTRTEDDPSWPYFVRHVSHPHLRVEMAACGSHQGGGAFKVKGPDVVVLAKENSTKHETGESVSSDAPVRERTMRWLYIRFDEGLMAWCGAAGVDVAATEAHGVVNGLLSFRPLEGAATSPTGTYLASGKTEWIDGDFRMHLAPLKNERAALALAGTLASTSMIVVPNPDAGAPGGMPSGIGLALIGFVFAAGATVGGLWLARAGDRRRHAVLRRRSRRGLSPVEAAATRATAVQVAKAWVRARYARVRFWHQRREGQQSLEECLDLANLAEAASDYERAILWYGRARQMFPERSDIGIDQARLLDYVGKKEEAIAVYEEVSILSSEGTAAFEAARILAQQDRLEEAEHFLERALRQSSELVLCVQDEHETFERMVGRPRFEQVMDEATLRFHQDRSGTLRP